MYSGTPTNMDWNPIKEELEYMDAINHRNKVYTGEIPDKYRFVLDYDAPYDEATARKKLARKNWLKAKRTDIWRRK